MVGVFHPAIFLYYLCQLSLGMTYPGFPSDDRPVVFPGENHTGRNLDRLEPKLDLYGNPSCSTSSFSTFCENVTHYPAQDIRRLIRIDPKTFKERYSIPVGITSRRPIAPEDLNEESVCRHRAKTFLPKIGKNENSNWRYVINDVDYVQTVVAEVCEKDGKPCAYIQDSLPTGYQSICKQRFAYKRLLAIDPDEKKTYMDSFQFPSCCSCYVKAPPLFERRKPAAGTVRTASAQIRRLGVRRN